MGRIAAVVPIARATAHRRFTEWVDQDVMQALHQAMLDVLGVAGQIDWSGRVRTVRRCTWYLPAIARTDMPPSESRRVAANRSTFDISGIGELPSRPLGHLRTR